VADFERLPNFLRKMPQPLEVSGEVIRILLPGFADHQPILNFEQSQSGGISLHDGWVIYFDNTNTFLSKNTSDCKNKSILHASLRHSPHI